MNKNNFPFDPTARIERQRCPLGTIVAITIAPTELQLDYPVAVWFEGIQPPRAYTMAGDDLKNAVNPEADLYTVPEHLPVIRTFLNLYPEGRSISGKIHTTLCGALLEMHSCPPLYTPLATVEVIFDPNTGVVTTKSWNAAEYAKV